jgi:hypothetical protein
MSDERKVLAGMDTLAGERRIPTEARRKVGLARGDAR